MNFSKILKEQQLERLYHIEDYSAKVKQQSTQMLSEAKAQVKEIKDQAYAKGAQQIHKEHQQLLEETSKKVNNFIDFYESKIGEIAKCVLDKLGVNIANDQLIFDLIHQEVQTLNLEDHCNIYIHSSAVEAMKVKLANYSSFTTVRPDDSLLHNECLLTTNLYSLRLNTTDLLMQIDTILIQ